MVRRLWKSDRGPDRYDRSGSPGDHNKEDEDPKEEETKENERGLRSDVVREREQLEEAVPDDVPMPLQHQTLPGPDEPLQAQNFGVSDSTAQAEAGPSRLNGNSRAGAEQPPRLKRERPQINDRVQSPHPNDPVEEDDIDISLDDIDMAFSASSSQKSSSPPPTCSAPDTPRLVLRPPRPPPRSFDQRDLGLPERGIPRLKDGHKHVYHGPMGRRVVVSNEHNPNYRSKDQPFLWVRIQNDDSDVSLTGKKAADLYEEVVMAMAQRGYGAIRSETEASRCQPKSKSAVATEITLPHTMGIEPILSDSGQNSGRGRMLVHLTFAAALYMVGWLDDDFELINGEPDWNALIEWFDNAQEMQLGGDTSEQGQVEADSGDVEEDQTSTRMISNPVLQQHALPNDRAGAPVQRAVANDRAGAPVERDPPSDRRARTRSSDNPPAFVMLNYGEKRRGAVLNTDANWAEAGLPSPAEYNALQPVRRKAKQKAENGRKISGLPSRGGYPVEIERKTPKFWEICEPLRAGNFCATLCRIQVPGQERTDRHRSYRTMCILTTSPLPIPMGRPLPTCKAVVKVDAVLEACRDIHLDDSRLRKAIKYTVKMFSLPRRKALEAHALPYLVLPMSMQWSATYNAMSEVESIRHTDVERNLAWAEIDSALDHEKETRMVHPLDSIERKRGGAMAAFAEESIYIIHGAQYNEVHSTRWDEQSRARARQRAVEQAVRANPEGPEEVPEIQGPVFELRQIPDFWNPSHAPVTTTNICVDPNLEPRSTIARSIYHSAHMLPWIMWTIDGLLLAEEVNTQYLGARADTYDVLAALSTTQSSRHTDLEVLEFAGDTYWKFAATEYHFHSSPTKDYQELNRLVRGITDNVPLARGMKESGAENYIMNDPVDTSNFLPPGCGYQNSHGRNRPPRLNQLSLKSIADVAEALAGAVGKVKSNELLLRTCMRLFPSAFPFRSSYPPHLSWQAIARMDNSLNFGNRSASQSDVDYVQRVTGHEFENRNLLGLILDPRNACRGGFNSISMRLTFLGNAIFDCILMDYLIAQGAVQNLDPGRLTHWRSNMASSVSLATLWVNSGLHKLVGGNSAQTTDKIHQFEYELQKTVDTQTELHMAWTKIPNAPKLDGHVYLLLAGVLADSGWSFSAATDLFNRLYLPFFARFVGSYDRDRLDSIPEPGAAKSKLQHELMPCKDVQSTTTVMPHGIFNTDVKCHSRVIGNGRSLYKVAAEGFAYREAQKFILDASLRSALLKKYCNCLDGLSRQPAAKKEVPPQSEELMTGIRQADRKQETLSDDGFEIVEDPGPVGSAVGQLSTVVPATRKASSSDDSDEHERKNKLSKYDT